MSGKTSRTKGANAENEVAREIHDLLGVRMSRRLRQYQAGGCDLQVDEGQEGAVADLLRRLAIEVKRHATATQAQVAGWWRQAVEQAHAQGTIPCLAYREDRQQWRVVLPLNALISGAPADWSHQSTAELSLWGFATWARECPAETIRRAA